MNNKFWQSLKYISPNEFIDDITLANPQLFINLNQTRITLNKSIHPSPVEGSLARLYGRKTSAHYAVGKLSTGVDVFIEGIPLRNFNTLIRQNLFTGIGIYLDTNGPDGKPWVMFHLDMRPIPLIWFAEKNIKKSGWVYTYESDRVDFWKKFRDLRMYINRR